jgi:hypothetical protein
VGLLEHSLGAQAGQLRRSETQQQLQGDLFRLSQQKDRLEAEIKIVWTEVAQTLRESVVSLDLQPGLRFRNQIARVWRFLNPS